MATATLNAHKRDRILDRLLRSGSYRDIVAEEQAKTAAERRALVKDLHDGMPAENKRMEDTAKQMRKRRAERDAAEAAFKAAQIAEADARILYLSAEAVTVNRRGRILAQLEESADPRIRDLESHLWALHDRAGLCVRATSIEERRDVGGSRAVFHFNADAVGAARQALRALIDDLKAMRTQDYGADPRQRLEAIRDAAYSAVRDLGAMESDVGGFAAYRAAVVPFDLDGE